MSRWEAYPFGGVLVLSMLGFFTPSSDLPAGPPVSDKLEHAAIFVALVLTGRLAGFRLDRLLRGLLGYALLTEALQAVLPIHRDGDWRDVAADVIGMLIGVAVVLLLRRLIGDDARERDRPARR
jgi:VanZ family protein